MERGILWNGLSAGKDITKALSRSGEKLQPIPDNDFYQEQHLFICGNQSGKVMKF